MKETMLKLLQKLSNYLAILLMYVWFFWCNLAFSSCFFYLLGVKTNPSVFGSLKGLPASGRFEFRV